MATTITGPLGQDSMTGSTGSDLLQADGPDGSDVTPLQALFDGSAGLAGVSGSGSGHMQVGGYTAGTSATEADFGLLGGHKAGMGVQASQAERPSISQETGYDPVRQESEGVVFELAGDALRASFDLSYFFSQASGADGWHDEVGRWTVFEDDTALATGLFVADHKNGSFSFDIPSLDDGNTTFNKVVLDALPYAAPDPDSGQRAWNLTRNAGLDGDSSDFLVKTAQIDLVHHDSLHGASGIDTLDGGLGRDTLDGGADTDLLQGGKDSDFLYGRGDGDTLDGGADRDIVDYRHYHPSPGKPLVVDLINQQARAGSADLLDTLVSIEDAHGSFSADRLIGNDQDNALQGLWGNDTIIGGGGRDGLLGGKGADQLYGDAGADYLVGFEGNDRLYGGEGHDNLKGGAGKDFLHGGNGVDMAHFMDGGDVHVDLSRRAVHDDGQGNRESIIAVEHLHSGDGNDRLIGDAQDNLFRADFGHNTIDGGAGNDTLSYIYGIEDQVEIDLAAGIAQHFDLAADGSVYTDQFSSIENVVGSHRDDIIRGDAQENSLRGLEGADRIEGRGGADFLQGGEGDDHLFGGVGRDTLQGGAGTDLLLGNQGDDVLDGGAGDDLLFGGTGADRFHGGSGDDLLLWDDQDLSGNLSPEAVVYHGGAGFDVLYAGAAKGDITLAGGAVRQIEAVIGDGRQADNVRDTDDNTEAETESPEEGVGSGESGFWQHLTASLEEIQAESDSDNLNNADFVDPFDDSFLVFGIDDMTITGRDHPQDGDRQWQLISAEEDMALDEAIQLEMGKAGFGSITALNAFTFAKGEAQVTLWTDLDSLAYDSNQDGLDMEISLGGGF